MSILPVICWPAVRCLMRCIMRCLMHRRSCAASRALPVVRTAQACPYVLSLSVTRYSTPSQSALSRHGNHVMPPCCAAVRYGPAMCSIWARYGLAMSFASLNLSSARASSPRRRARSGKRASSPVDHRSTSGKIRNETQASLSNVCTVPAMAAFADSAAAVLTLSAAAAPCLVRAREGGKRRKVFRASISLMPMVL